MNADAETQEDAHHGDTLLEVVRQLAVELHPHRAGSLRVEWGSTLDQDLGLDSLGRVELLVRIEQAFGLRLPEQVISLAETPADLLQALERGRPSQAGSPGFQERDVALEAVEANPDRAETLMEVLEWHVAHHPDRPHINFHDEEGETHVLTYQGLLEGSRKLAAGLQQRDLRPGQPVAIMLPTGLEYFFSFMGTLMAGGIPVPIYPPARPSQIEDHLRRHANILDNAGTPVLITIPEAKIAARLLKMQVEALREIATPQELAATTESPYPIERTGQDIAHLQYTSGSTGHPKGVVLTHDNLLSNVRAMAQVVEADSTDVFVSWLPLYHDMGLIGAWMGSMTYAMPLNLLSPLTFLARPETWLWNIHRHGGTISGAPNFAFELCLNRIPDERIEGLDLSSWRFALNGAEPVIPSTLRRFAERFEPYGFRYESLKPVYGLAEVSVGLAFPPPHRAPIIDRVQRDPIQNDGQAVPAEADDPTALEFVACGQPLPGHEVRIVNEAGQELGEREEGRLEFKGVSATSGYYRNPEETKALFHDGWVDSGDMAYISGGDIHLTGRRKDIIIRAGRNFHPYELETAIGAMEGIRKGCVAVFGSTDPATGTERIVALAETREKDPERLAELRRSIDDLAMDMLDTALDDVLLAPPHTVPKTSSGKIRRASSREVYEHGITHTGQRAVWWQVVRLWLSGLAPQTRSWRRVAGDMLWGGYALAVSGLLMPPAWVIAMAVPSPAWGWGVLRVTGRLLLGFTGIPIRVTGRENLPVGIPLVVAANHTSYLDGLAIALALPGVWSFVAKRELTGSFFARVVLKRLSTEFVERHDKQRGIEDARRVSKAALEGRSLVFFPEGTFRRTPGLHPFHMGAFQAAVEAGVPVLPVTIRGARSVLRDGHTLPRRGRLSVHVSPPIAPEGDGWDAAIALRDATRAEMMRHTGEPDLVDQRVVI